MSRYYQLVQYDLKVIFISDLMYKSAGQVGTGTIFINQIVSAYSATFFANLGAGLFQLWL
jgi:hypothetical protein